MIPIYLTGNSFLHRCPAGLKLLCVALASVALFRLESLSVFLGLLCLVLALYGSLGRKGLAQLTVLKGLAVFLAALLVIHGLSGTFWTGVNVLLRLTVLFLAAHLVSLTTRMDDMQAAVLPLFRPLAWIGLPPQKPALAMTLVLRFAPHMLQIHGKLKDAYRARTGRISSWRMLPPLAIQCLRLSDHVAEALQARGGSQGLAAPSTAPSTAPGAALSAACPGQSPRRSGGSRA